MQTEIITYETFEDEESVTNYRIEKGNGAIVIYPEKILNGPVSDCQWLDDSQNFIQLMHSEWDSTEHFAILKTNGDLVKKGIKEIHHYIPKANLFVVMFSGTGLGEDDATYYNVVFDDWKMAVIDQYGRYVLEPIYNHIQYYDDEDVLFADGNIYDFNGKFVKKDN